MLNKDKDILDKFSSVATKSVTKCDAVNKLPCCDYNVKKGTSPVFWNPYNQCVQCHNCGHVWIPSNLNKEIGSG